MSEKKDLCPNCGARLTGLELKCPECGYYLLKETSVSREMRDNIADLQARLANEKELEKKAAIISSFTAPQTEDGLLNLLVYSYSSFEHSNGLDNEMVSSAWLGKAKQTYQLLKIKANGDRETLSKIEKYAFLEEKKSTPKVKEAKSVKKKRTIIRWAVILAVLCFAVYLFLLILSKMGEPAEEKNVRQEVIELIQAGKFDEARSKANEAEYSWDRKEFLEMIEQEENKDIN